MRAIAAGIACKYVERHEADYFFLVQRFTVDCQPHHSRPDTATDPRADPSNRRRVDRTPREEQIAVTATDRRWRRRDLQLSFVLAAGVGLTWLFFTG